MNKKVIPYKNSTDSKKNQVAEMFNNIAKKYDFLNHFLSMGIDKLWRNKVISLLKKYQPKTILDIATGTGDLAITALKLNPDKIIGIDISIGMLKIGKDKIKKKGLENIIELLEGDSENIQFPNHSYDAAIVAFGVRNFENLQMGLSEIHRVLKPGSPFIVLEFSKPGKFPIKQVYNFYFTNILPFVGKLFSKDNSAYTYLPQSVNAFPEGNDFVEELKKTGFRTVKENRLSFGIASIYLAEK
ncbi:MAG: bifunctional demethylmenaquinone methyltransferase/2-methoxy-6-polyprenyl-1,4-benzoquinol methylase [Bacteroidetes bacterium 4572_117]|nr:MAG: bifunctional demethylmenaquinone methyltransferase/2-methoxy-6-polyprenyl-1,4-benzoquinol methylase [Bacteroidetes bacterium 4572_117]